MDNNERNITSTSNSDPVLEPAEYITHLLGEIEQADAEAFQPNYPLEEGDKVIGTVGGWNRKLFALGMYYARELARIEADLKFDPENSDLGARQDMTKACTRVLMGLFWASTRNEFNAWGKSVGIRKDWAFVYSNPRSEENGFAKFLREALGGGE